MSHEGYLVKPKISFFKRQLSPIARDFHLLLPDYHLFIPEHLVLGHFNKKSEISNFFYADSFEHLQRYSDALESGLIQIVRKHTFSEEDVEGIKNFARSYLNSRWSIKIILEKISEKCFLA